MYLTHKQVFVTSSSDTNLKCSFIYYQFNYLNWCFKSTSKNRAKAFNYSISWKTKFKVELKAKLRLMKDLWTLSSCPSSNTLMLSDGTPVKSGFEFLSKIWVLSLHFENCVDVELIWNKFDVVVPFKSNFHNKM